MPRNELRPGDERRLALVQLEAQVVTCARCPRLVAWREEVARTKVARFRDETYWGRPLPGFGDPGAGILVVGLAPAAHGGNRTGRIFTGDASGDFLWRSMHEVGLASQATSRYVGDGLTVRGAWVTAAVKCAPPGNAPVPSERDNCAPYLVRELAILADARVVVALGQFAWDAALRTLDALGARVPVPRPRFGHGAEAALGGWTVLGSYHPSQQNTFTGRLTQPMLRAVLLRATDLVSGRPG